MGVIPTASTSGGTGTDAGTSLQPVHVSIYSGQRSVVHQGPGVAIQSPLPLRLPMSGRMPVLQRSLACASRAALTLSPERRTHLPLRDERFLAVRLSGRRLLHNNRTVARPKRAREGRDHLPVRNGGDRPGLYLVSIYDQQEMRSSALS